MNDIAIAPTISILSGKQTVDLGYVRDKIYTRPDDIVIVAGTLVEGIGNRCSDFDIYVITGERPRMSDVDMGRHHWVYNADDNITTKKDGEVIQIFDYIDSGSLAWDVEYWTVGEVSELFDAMHRKYQDALTHTRNIPGLSYKVSGFLHRLFEAVPVQNEAQYRQLLKGISREELCFMGFRQFIGGYPTFRDIKGCWLDNDLQTALQVTRNYLTDQLFALTFAERLSNPNKKWLFKKLARLSPGNKPLAERYTELCFRGARTDAAKRTWILDAMRLIDDVFDAARLRLQQGDAFFSPETALALIEQERRTKDHPELERQLLFRRKIYQAGLPSCEELLTEA
jgi:hypothetical protein